MNYKLKIILAFLASSLFVIIGSIFKIMHLNGANILLIVGNLIMIVAFVYLLIKWTKKPTTNNSHTN
jgi:hypothetical protein